MLDEDAQHALEVAAVEDQQPVEALGADGSDESLGDGEPWTLVSEVEADVACLLGDPRAVGVGRAAGEPDAPACMRDEDNT
jgi:hypothetical protein